MGETVVSNLDSNTILLSTAIGIDVMVLPRLIENDLLKMYILKAKKFNGNLSMKLLSKTANRTIKM